MPTRRAFGTVEQNEEPQRRHQQKNPKTRNRFTEPLSLHGAEKHVKKEATAENRKTAECVQNKLFEPHIRLLQNKIYKQNVYFCQQTHDACQL